MNCSVYLKRAIASIAPISKQYGCRILLYHSIGVRDFADSMGLRVSKQQFKLQIEYLQENNYKIYALSDLVNKIVQGTMEDKMIAITFDDGYLDNLSYALPILSKHNIKFTIFVSPTILYGHIKKSGYWSNWKYFGWSDIANLISNGGEIGSHSLSHENLTVLNDELLGKEVVESKKSLEEHIGHPIKSFSYPFGRFNDNIKKIVSNAGYDAACSSLVGLNTGSTDLFELKRTEITGYDSLSDFIKKLNGRYDWLNIVQKLRRLDDFR